MAQHSPSAHLVQARGAGNLRVSRFILAAWEASGKIKTIDCLQAEENIMLQRSLIESAPCLGIGGASSFGGQPTAGVVNIPIGPSISA